MKIITLSQLLVKEGIVSGIVIQPHQFTERIFALRKIKMNPTKET